jgi:hypothetical protein
MMKRLVMALNTWINLFEPGTDHLRDLAVIFLHFMKNNFCHQDPKTPRLI